MTRLTVPLLGGAVVAALIAGCGSSSSSSSATSTPASTATPAAGAQVDSTYAAAAGPICTAAIQQVAAVQIPGDPTKATAADLPAWSAYVDKVIPIQAGALQKLVQLPPTTTATAELAAAGAKGVTVTSDLAALGAAAKAGNINQFDTALLTYNQDNMAANAAFDAIGLSACGSGTKAATSTTSSSTT